MAEGITIRFGRIVIDFCLFFWTAMGLVRHSSLKDTKSPDRAGQSVRQSLQGRPLPSSGIEGFEVPEDNCASKRHSLTFAGDTIFRMAIAPSSYKRYHAPFGCGSVGVSATEPERQIADAPRRSLICQGSGEHR